MAELLDIRSPGASGKDTKDINGGHYKQNVAHLSIPRGNAVFCGLPSFLLLTNRGLSTRANLGGPRYSAALLILQAGGSPMLKGCLLRGIRVRVRVGLYLRDVD